MKIKREYGKISSNVNFYNENALSYYNESQLFNMNKICDDFLKIADLPSGAKILDAGCGSGRDSLYFIDKGYKVLSIDASEKLIEICKDKHNLNAEVQDLTKLTYYKEFDAVWCCATLLHLPEIEFDMALGNLSDSLKEDGTLYFSIKKITNHFMTDSRNRTFYNVGIDTMHSILTKHNLELVSYYETGKQTEQSQIFENYILKKRDLNKIKMENKK